MPSPENKRNKKDPRPVVRFQAASGSKADSPVCTHEEKEESKAAAEEKGFCARTTALKTSGLAQDGQEAARVPWRPARTCDMEMQSEDGRLFTLDHCKDQAIPVHYTTFDCEPGSVHDGHHAKTSPRTIQDHGGTCRLKRWTNGREFWDYNLFKGYGRTKQSNSQEAFASAS